jgi:Zn-dependent peptidase ImmA (M78 family)
MKNSTVGEYEKRDIEQQVDKVLRSLGNPEPPLDLREVRELLKLDLQYYSRADDAVVQEIVSKVKIGLKQIVSRPTILWDVITKAKLSALWVPDRKRILLDATTPVLKHRWFEGHETLHSITPWHEQFLYGDTTKELNPACEEAIEAEANFGAGQLLFLRDRFTQEAKDMPMTIATIKALAQRFGNTITSTLWRYVDVACDEIPVLGLISAHPRYVNESKDPLQPCRHCVESPKFKEQFAHLSELELFGKLFGYCKYNKRGSIGEGEVILIDLNGDDHLFHFESFSIGYDVLTLATHQWKAPVSVSVA